MRKNNLIFLLIILSFSYLFADELVTRDGKTIKDIAVIFPHESKLEVIFKNNKKMYIEYHRVTDALRKKYKLTPPKTATTPKDKVAKIKTINTNLNKLRKENYNKFITVFTRLARPYFVKKPIRLYNFSKKRYQGFKEGDLLLLTEFNNTIYLQDDKGNMYINSGSSLQQLRSTLEPAVIYLWNSLFDIKRYSDLLAQTEIDQEVLKNEKILADKILVSVLSSGNNGKDPTNAEAELLTVQRLKLFKEFERKTETLGNRIKGLSRTIKRYSLFLEYLSENYIKNKNKLLSLLLKSAPKKKVIPPDKLPSDKKVKIPEDENIHRKKLKYSEIIKIIEQKGKPYFVKKACRLKKYRKKGKQGFREGCLLFGVYIDKKIYLKDDQNIIYSPLINCPNAFAKMMAPAEEFLKAYRDRISKSKKIISTVEKKMADLKNKIHKTDFQLISLLNNPPEELRKMPSKMSSIGMVNPFSSVRKQKRLIKKQLANLQHERDQHRLIIDFINFTIHNFENSIKQNITKPDKNNILLGDLSDEKFIFLFEKKQVRISEIIEQFEIILSRKTEEYQNSSASNVTDNVKKDLKENLPKEGTGKNSVFAKLIDRFATSLNRNLRNNQHGQQRASEDFINIETFLKNYEDDIINRMDDFDKKIAEINSIEKALREKLGLE